MGDSYYCEPCGSYHPDPRDEAHWRALYCRRPWGEWADLAAHDRNERQTESERLAAAALCHLIVRE